MLSFEKFAGAGVRPLQPPLFSVFPRSAPVLGGCAVNALALRWRGAFSEGGRNWFEPVLTWFY